MFTSFFVGAALANGQTTHMWISHEALEVLPEGDLKSFLEQPEHLAALENGTMFPDGGYAVGHPYGETAHWEPFQGLFRDWILDNYQGPEDPAAGRDVAFYLGMASHGMADQVFDALYMERSKQKDAAFGWSTGESLDTSSDIVWAWETGSQVPPEAWVPPIMKTLFAEVGIEIDDETLMLGQERLGLAIDFVGVSGQIESGVETHRAHFPWACNHLTDRSVPGGPYSEAEIIAHYWMDLWDELHGDSLDLEVLATFPGEGGREHHKASEDVESRLTVVFNRSLLSREVQEATVLLEGEGAVPVLDPWLFYRDDSHVLHLDPDVNWSDNTDYTVTLKEGIEGTDGRALQSDFVLNFSTKPFEDPRQNTDPCTCSSHSGARVAWAWLAAVAVWRRRARPGPKRSPHLG
ncbi:MAG: Ig-like domain-containing protein [Myxococcota bacterium]|nr:Ig-like domain-containing protein [Myxococcota bacterium]